MIMYDENVDQHFDFGFCFKYAVGRLGYVLASPLMSRKLFRPYIDQQFSKNKCFPKNEE